MFVCVTRRARDERQRTARQPNQVAKADVDRRQRKLIAAIATALHRSGAYEDALFLIGMRWVQREPVWGGTVDVACELRSMCAMALLRLGHPSAATEVAELLADPEPAARAGAAHAIAYSEDARFAPPTLVVVGEVVRLQATLAWFGPAALRGPRRAVAGAD